MYELKEEMLTFFSLEGKDDFCELLADATWCAKLAYRADIFGLLKLKIPLKLTN